MISQAKFLATQPVIIRVSEFYPQNQDGYFRIKFPDTFTDNGKDIGKKLYDIAVSEERFDMIVWHFDGSQEEYNNCLIERLSMNLDAEDSLDITILIDGEKSNRIVHADEQKSEDLAKTVGSRDCFLHIKDYLMNDLAEGMIYSFCFFLDREDPRIHGMFKAYNSFIGNKGKTVTRMANDYKMCSIDFGYLYGEEKEIILALEDIELNIARRDLKKGVDIVEVAFVGNKETL